MTLYIDYDAWIVGVASFLDVTDVETNSSTYNQIGTFIRLAELEMDRTLRLREAMRFATNEIDNDGILTLPDDFAQMKSVIATEESRPIEAITVDQYWNTFTRPLGQAGRPQYYTIIGTNLQFVPRGDGESVQIAYYRRTAPLGPNIPETTYTIYAPEILLAGSVMYGMQHLFEEERMGPWKEKFYSGIAEANRTARSAELGSSPLKMRIGNRAPVRRYR